MASSIGTIPMDRKFFDATVRTKFPITAIVELGPERRHTEWCNVRAEFFVLRLHISASLEQHLYFGYAAGASSRVQFSRVWCRRIASVGGEKCREHERGGEFLQRHTRDCNSGKPIDVCTAGGKKPLDRQAKVACLVHSLVRQYCTSLPKNVESKPTAGECDV